MANYRERMAERVLRLSDLPDPDEIAVGDEDSVIAIVSLPVQCRSCDLADICDHDFEWCIVCQQ